MSCFLCLFFCVLGLWAVTYTWGVLSCFVRGEAYWGALAIPLLGWHGWDGWVLRSLTAEGAYMDGLGDCSQIE